MPTPRPDITFRLEDALRQRPGAAPSSAAPAADRLDDVLRGAPRPTAHPPADRLDDVLHGTTRPTAVPPAPRGTTSTSGIDPADLFGGPRNRPGPGTQRQSSPGRPVDPGDSPFGAAAPPRTGPQPGTGSGPLPGPGPGTTDLPDLVPATVTPDGPAPAGRRGPLLPFLALLLLGWSATCLVTVDRPALAAGLLATATAVCPLAAVLAVAVAAVAVHRRRWVTSAILLAAGLLPWGFAVPYAIAQSPPAGPTTPVRVLVVNAHEGSAAAADVNAAIRDQAADVLVVTELTGRLAHDLTATGLGGLTARWVTVPGPGTDLPAKAGLGIWSRPDLTGFTAVPGTHWPAVRAQLATGRGTLTLVAGHAVAPGPLDAGTWAEDLGALHAAGSVPGPVAVVGGLNGTPWNPQYRAAASGPLRDAAEVLGSGVRPTWPTWLGVPLLPLDHALVGGGVGVHAVLAVTIRGTDHRGLLVTLLVPDRR